jgi:hypothetical protein
VDGTHTETVGSVPAVDSTTVIENPAATRRLTVDELQASVGVVAGVDAAGEPIGWKVKIGTKVVDGLSNAGFGKTLGRPDFVTATEEDSFPNALWLKFTQDMARSTCNTIVAADLARADGETPTLWALAPIHRNTTEHEIGANLAHLVLRFWGFGAQEAADHIEALRDVYDAGVAAHVTDDGVPPQAEGWRAVCVALFEDPAFHLH